MWICKRKLRILWSDIFQIWRIAWPKESRGDQSHQSSEKRERTKFIPIQYNIILDSWVQVLAYLDPRTWKKVRVDFSGPFGKRMALVLWNYQYSRMPVVEFASSTSAECAVPMMKKIFNTYGVPEEVKSDNGPPFNSKKFKEFAEEQGFQHRKVTPGWAEANGDVERMVKECKNFKITKQKRRASSSKNC